MGRFGGWIFCALEVLGAANICGQTSCRDNVRLRYAKCLEDWGMSEN